MCECSNTMQIHCLCRANWLIGDPGGTGGPITVTRETYQTGMAGEVARNTQGRWNTPNLQDLGFRNETLNVISNGDLIFVGGGNKEPGTGWRIASFDWQYCELQWNIVIPGFTPMPGGGGEDFIAKALTGPWGVEFWDAGPTTRHRVDPLGAVVTPTGGVPSGFTDYVVQTHHNSDPRVFLLGGNTGTGTGTGFVGTMNATGVVSASQSVFSNSLGFSGGVAAQRNGQNYHAAQWREDSPGTPNKYRFSTPWGSGELTKDSTYFSPHAHECWGGGLAMVYSDATFPYTDFFGDPRVGDIARLGYVGPEGSWNVPLWVGTSDGGDGAVVNWVFADESSLWINFSQNSLLSVPFPEFFAEGTRSAAPFNTIRIAKDRSAVDMVTPQTVGDRLHWPMQRLDCIAKFTPTQFKRPV